MSAIPDGVRAYAAAKTQRALALLDLHTDCGPRDAAWIEAARADLHSALALLLEGPLAVVSLISAAELLAKANLALASVHDDNPSSGVRYADVLISEARAQLKPYMPAD